jgi:hypothetical protein
MSPHKAFWFLIRSLNEDQSFRKERKKNKLARVVSQPASFRIVNREPKGGELIDTFTLDPLPMLKP